MKVLVIGPQGSGKTTQARRIAQKFGLCMIKTGEILRELSEQDSETGAKVKQMIEKGELIDDATVAEIVRKRTEEVRCRDGFVIDGYPRTMEQVQLFDPGFNKVVYLQLSDQEAMKRLLKREREDDTPELIKERLSLYHEETKPIIDYYNSLNNVVTVNGEQSETEVENDIFKALEGG